MAANATYNDDAWPMVVVTMPSVSMTGPELSAHLARISGYYERGRFGLVVDSRAQNKLPSEDRRRIAKRMDEDEARHPDRLACIGVVMSSPFQRGVFTTISWLTNAPFARETFRSVDLAKAWVRERLAPIK
jgi:hypothetical protein